MSGEFRQRIGERYIAFARKWMNYVLTKCESGRGTRPRLAPVLLSTSTKPLLRHQMGGRDILI